MLTDTPIGALRLAPICFEEADDQGTPKDDPKPDVKAEPKDDQSAAFAALRRELNAEKRAREAAEAKVADADRKKAEQQGEWKEIAEKAEARAADLEAKIAASERRSAVSAIAKRLQFADPEDAYRFLDGDVDAADEQLAERALKALAKAKPYLLAPAPTRTGREVTGGNGNDTDTPAVPKGPDGKPDLRAAMGQGLLAAIDDMRGKGLIGAGAMPDDTE